jgi:hypothetical protein
MQPVSRDVRWQRGWPARAARLDLIRESPSEEQKLWAIRTLVCEAAVLQRRFLRTGEAPGKDFGAYYRTLALFVARLGDERSIEALALASDVAPAVPEALARFGEEAVEPVIRTLHNPFLREAAVVTLGRILQGAKESSLSIGPVAMRRIRRALMQAALRETGSMQRCAVRSLSHTTLTAHEIDALRRLVPSTPRPRG